MSEISELQARQYDLEKELNTVKHRLDKLEREKRIKNKIKVMDVPLGDLVHVYNLDTGLNDGAGPFIKTNHSLIDRTGSNWYLGECKDLIAIKADPRESTFDQLNEFRLQVVKGYHLEEYKED